MYRWATHSWSCEGTCPQSKFGNQEQHPDLLVLTGLPVSSRIVSAFLSVTGWLAFLHHQQATCRGL